MYCQYIPCCSTLHRHPHHRRRNTSLWHRQRTPPGTSWRRRLPERPRAQSDVDSAGRDSPCSTRTVPRDSARSRQVHTVNQFDTSAELYRERMVITPSWQYGTVPPCRAKQERLQVVTFITRPICNVNLPIGSVSYFERSARNPWRIGNNVSTPRTGRVWNEPPQRAASARWLTSPTPRSIDGTYSRWHETGGFPRQSFLTGSGEASVETCFTISKAGQGGWMDIKS